LGQRPHVGYDVYQGAKKMKEFLFKLKVFLYDLIVESFRSTWREIKIYFSNTRKYSIRASKPAFLVRIFFTAFLISVMVFKNFSVGWAFLIAATLSFLKYRWDDGSFMYRYRERRNLK